MSPWSRITALLLLAVTGGVGSGCLRAQAAVAAPDPCAARAAGPRLPGPTVQLAAVLPNEFAPGDRVTLCGAGLFYTYQANPSAVLQDSRMLRIGDWYLPIGDVAVSNRGDRLSFTIIDGGPFQRLPAATTGVPVAFGFVADRSGRATVSGPIALNSLASPPDPKRQHSTDVAMPTPSVWTRQARKPNDKPDGFRPSSRE